LGHEKITLIGMIGLKRKIVESAALIP